MIHSWLAALAALAALCAGVTACAAPNSYSGIAFNDASVPLPVRRLAFEALRGDKQAQFLLGQHFEEGWGVGVDRVRARRLYAQAAADSGGQIWVYVPGIGKGESGRVVPVNTGPRQPGLTEARERLAAMEKGQ